MTDNDHKPTVPLREYIENRLDTLEKGMEQRFEHSEEQTKIAYEAMQGRLAGMNEMRGALLDQATKYLPRTESETEHGRIDEDIRSLRESRSEIAGKASQTSMLIAIVISILGLLVGAISLTIRDRGYHGGEPQMIQQGPTPGVMP